MCSGGSLYAAGHVHLAVTQLQNKFRISFSWGFFCSKGKSDNPESTDPAFIFDKCSLLNLRLLPAPEGRSSLADQDCWVLLQDKGDKTKVLIFCCNKIAYCIIEAQNNEEKGRQTFSC